MAAFTITEGCHNAQHFETGRRKRDLSDDYLHMRGFFEECLSDKLEVSSIITEVDFVILDSMWFINTDVMYCKDGADTADCWKTILKQLLIPGQLYDMAASCIDLYSTSDAQNYNEIPMRKRRDVSYQSSKPRNTYYFDDDYEYSKATIFHGRCMQDKYREESRGIGTYNFVRLSAFVETQTVIGCAGCSSGKDVCFSGSQEYEEMWQDRYSGLSSPASVLRAYSVQCASELNEQFSHWGQWSSWSSCSSTCGKGEMIKTRECLAGRNENQCVGESVEMKDCVNILACQSICTDRYPYYCAKNKKKCKSKKFLEHCANTCLCREGVKPKPKSKPGKGPGSKHDHGPKYDRYKSYCACENQSMYNEEY